MKNKLLPIIGISITLLVSLCLRTSSVSIAADGIPYPAIPESNENSPSACLQSVANEMYIMRKAWNANIKLLTEQQKPTSEMVDDAFSDMRTYKCWLQYLCESVLYTGSYTPKTKVGDVPIAHLLPSIPNCVSPTKVVIPGTQLKYMQYCSVDSTLSAPLGYANANYQQCLDLLNLQFSDVGNTDLQDSPVGRISSKLRSSLNDSSGAVVGLVSALKANNADQMSVVLQSKLQSILVKMKGMEGHMTALLNNMNRFDQRLECLAPYCD